MQPPRCASSALLKDRSQGTPDPDSKGFPKRRGLGFGVKGLGSRVKGLGSRVKVLGSRVKGLGSRG